MKPVVVLQNEPDAPAAYLGDALDRRDVEWTALRLDAGDVLPDPGRVSGVAALLFAASPGITADGVRDRITRYARPLGSPDAPGIGIPRRGNGRIR